MAIYQSNHDFRRMEVSDIDRVIVNERSSYSHPWKEAIFRDCLRANHECWVLSWFGDVVGHSVLSAAAQEAHLLNVCIHPEQQGNGLGRDLVKFMIDCARSKKAKRIFLEVRASNIVAYKLYESIGFNEIGVRENYYPAYIGREDAIVLGKELL